MLVSQPSERCLARKMSAKDTCSRNTMASSQESLIVKGKIFIIKAFVLASMFLIGFFIDGMDAQLNHTVTRRLNAMAYQVPGRNDSLAMRMNQHRKQKANGNLIYYGGAVLSNVKVVLILWGGSTNVRYASNITNFYAAVTSSTWFNVLFQYKTDKQSIGSGSLHATYSDSSAPSGSLSQTTIESRLSTLIATGKVPSPDANTYYAIHFATGTTASDQCRASIWGTICGWHTMMYATSSSNPVYYGAMPDQVGCGYCDSGNGLADIFTVSSHELAEAVTDPGVGDGWIDSSDNEIGDYCGSLSNRVGSTEGRDGQTYAVELIWSNSAGKCIDGVRLGPTSSPTAKPSGPTSYPTMKPSFLRDNRMTDDNIHSAAYQWVTDNDYAMAAYGAISYWDTSRVTNMSNVFGDCNPVACSFDYSHCTYGCPLWQSYFNADLSTWDTSHVKDMSGMFSYAEIFNSVLSKWDTSYVTNMYRMFYKTYSFDQILCWNTTLANTGLMFDGGSSGSLSPYPGCLTAMPTVIPTARPTGPSAQPTLKPTFIDSIFRISTGPIRSFFGGCIDIPFATYVNGKQLQVNDCDGGYNQLWGRETATDLTLRTQNNMCMDASGNVGAGGAVVISTCNTNLDSQKWMFDGKSLHPVYNTTLCLAIRGDNALGAKLIVSPCDNGSKSAWVEYSISSLMGTASGGYNHYLCPVGSKVVNISGRGGYFVDQLVMTCDDSSNTVLGPAGGSGGSTMTSPNCAKGYNNVTVTSGRYVGKIIAQCSGSSKLSVSIGAGWDGGSGPTESNVLQGSQRIIGMQVYSDRYVNAIAWLYGAAQPSTEPTAKPTTTITVIPTVKPTARPTGPTAQPTLKPTLIDSIFRTSAGPIRNLLGRCIDVPYANYVSGKQLQVYDCHGGDNQQWVRPSSSTDLSLQTENNMCMDAADNVGAGGAVVISTCNSNLDSQKWIFDGKSLHSKYNTELCLAIEGDNALGAKLIVSLCDNDSKSAWVEYSMYSFKEIYNGWIYYYDSNHYLCPVGSKVINISGRGGYFVDQLVMTCDDGSNTVLGPAGDVGGASVTSPNCVKGYNNVTVTVGRRVGQVLAQCSGSSILSVSIGEAMNAGSGIAVSLELEGSQRIIGMHVYKWAYSDDLDGLGGLALMYGAAQTSTEPTARPSLQASGERTNRSSVNPMALIVALMLFVLVVILYVIVFISSRIFRQ